MIDKDMEDFKRTLEEISRATNQIQESFRLMGAKLDNAAWRPVPYEREKQYHKRVAYNSVSGPKYK